MLMGKEALWARMAVSIVAAVSERRGQQVIAEAGGYNN